MHLILELDKFIIIVGMWVLDWARTYHTMKKLNCQKCKYNCFCCTYKVKLTWWNILRIKLKGYSNFWERDSKYKSIKIINNYCYFFDKNKKCKIHSLRPKPCRTFPFLYSEITGCEEFYGPWKKHRDKIRKLLSK